MEFCRNGGDYDWENGFDKWIVAHLLRLKWPSIHCDVLLNVVMGLLVGVFMDTVISADNQGVPVVKVPCQYLWDMVEYLSAQRLSVLYSYHNEYFEVRFPRMAVADVQRTFDQWANANAQRAA